MVQPWTTDFISLSLHFLICQMGTMVPTSWAGLSEIIAQHLSSIHYEPGAFLGNGEPVVKTKSWTQWSLHSTGHDKTLKTKQKKKKKSFQGIISPKRHYSKRMQGHSVTVCLEWALRSSSGKLGFEQRPKLSKDGS